MYYIKCSVDYIISLKLHCITRKSLMPVFYIIYYIYNLLSPYRILYASLHRYDYGYFYPCRKEAGPTYTGGDNAPGFNVNVAWNGDMMGDSEYLAAFHHIIMPIACEVHACSFVMSIDKWTRIDSCVAVLFSGTPKESLKQVTMQ